MDGETHNLQAIRVDLLTDVISAGATSQPRHNVVAVALSSGKVGSQHRKYIGMPKLCPDQELGEEVLCDVRTAWGKEGADLQA